MILGDCVNPDDERMEKGLTSSSERPGEIRAASSGTSDYTFQATNPFRSISASVWLGLYHDLSWTHPAAVMFLRTIGPLASVISVSIIYWLGSTQSLQFDPSRLAFVLVGAALYTHIAAYSYTPTYAVAEGKNLSVFPHIYIAPTSTASYIAGRTLASFVISFVSLMLALVGAYYILGGIFHVAIPLLVTPASVLMLAAALVLNIPAALGLGYVLGAYSLFASKFEWALPSYISGLLMVFSGALFSPSILPWPFSTLANLLPYTQFINAARDAVVYGLPGAYVTALALSVAGGLLFLLVGLVVYSASERKARRDGVIDRRLA
jgi:ABC-type polysaccharide/polyol phosphate export permease